MQDTYEPEVLNVLAIALRAMFHATFKIQFGLLQFLLPYCKLCRLVLGLLFTVDLSELIC